MYVVKYQITEHLENLVSAAQFASGASLRLNAWHNTSKRQIDN
jgi:hypothetical protein